MNKLGAMLVALSMCACEDGEQGALDADTSATDGGREASAQTPPRGAVALEAWLERGEYESWRCEPTVHASRAPSPHGFNRICSNDLISANAEGSAVWPRGAAAVKELYTSIDADRPAGYAVYLKTEDDSSGGAAWYWFERLPGGSLVADGLGSGAREASICVSCHLGAGSDAARTPSPGARDQVYTPVR